MLQPVRVSLGCALLLFALNATPPQASAQRIDYSAMTNAPAVLQPAQPLAPVTPRRHTPTLGEPATPGTLAPASPYSTPARESLPPPPMRPHPGEKPGEFRESLRSVLNRPTPDDMLKTSELMIAESVAAATPEEEPVAVAATEFYVATEGSDENPGTESHPWRTLQKAAREAQPGQTILVYAGRYAGFHTVRGGTPTAPITFRALSPQVIIEGNNPRTPDGINVENTDYVVIEGFQVRNAKRAGIRVVESRGVVIQQNECGPNGIWGIFTGFTPELRILRNKTFDSAEQHGIYVSNSRVPDDNVVIQGNHCYGNHQNGIQLNGDCQAGGDGIIEGALIEGNLVYGNGFKGLSLISMNGSTVQNNLIFDNGKRAGAGGIHLTDEGECGKGSSGNVIVNNTIVEPRIAGIRITDAARDNVIFNNLIVGPRPLIDEVGGNPVDSGSNALFPAGHSLFMAPSAMNFRPLPGGPIGLGRAEFQGKPAPARDLDGLQRATALPTIGAYR